VGLADALLLVRRWYPERQIVAVADGGYASLKLLDRCQHLKRPITFLTRLTNYLKTLTVGYHASMIPVYRGGADA
jgi:hypothetical protein